MHAKEKVALASVFAAVILVVAKITIGLLTNSLGILSEALHSSIDLIAAAMTLFAVRAAARPADEDHMYGHEKIESLSSLGETLLLFITCAWIVYEAINRLLHGAIVEVTWIAIGVMVMSIIIDFSRSRALHRAAVKYKSQALEADAIHFSTDLISSVVVIVGLLFTIAGVPYVDSIAAIGVAVVTAVIGWRLWKRSMGTLMDRAPEGLSKRVAEEIMSVPGIHKVERVRVRESGAITFIEATIFIDKSLPIEQGHRLMDLAEEKVKAGIPNCDIIVHAEPICLETASLEERIRAEAANVPEIRDVHNIVFTEGPSGRLVEFHLEMDGDLTVEEAHKVASNLEDKVLNLDPCIHKVASHVEPACGPACQGETSQYELEIIRDTIDHLHGLFPEVISCKDVHVHLTKGGYKVWMACEFDSGLSVNKAHEVATRLEGHIRSRHSEVESVIIHYEPGA
jgi:cation diffusion facilitator family transporter